MDIFKIHQQIMFEIIKQVVEKLESIGGQEGPYIIHSLDFLDILLNYNSSWGEFSEASAEDIAEMAKKLKESGDSREVILRNIFYHVSYAFSTKHECVKDKKINLDNIIWVD